MPNPPPKVPFRLYRTLRSLRSPNVRVLSIAHFRPKWIPSLSRFLVLLPPWPRLPAPPAAALAPLPRVGPADAHHERLARGVPLARLELRRRRERLARAARAAGRVGRVGKVVGGRGGGVHGGVATEARALGEG
jgi:hypothetical protein